MTVTTLIVITWLKFLVDKGDFDFIVSGSLLGVALENIRSLPVGYLTEVQMYPLDFEEFCWANGLDWQVFNSLRAAMQDRIPVEKFLHERMMQMYRRYLLVGGMPDAVNAYLQANSIDAVRTVQDDIRRYYKGDIGKYAPKDRRLVIQNIYDLIPSELAGKNRRFKLSSIADIKRFTQIEQEFLWLLDAGVALAAYNVREPISPLLLNESHSLFKLFYSDIGLLTSTFPKDVSAAVLDGRSSINLGGTYKNAVAQELVAHGFALRYYSGKKIGELDFVVEDRGGGIIVLEVKSSSNYLTHTSLDKALSVKNYAIDEAYVLAETNLAVEDKVVFLPIYMTTLLINE
ncbi:MAG: ATP-binding protein [Coriobacteriales bacterium]|nr:ATP-binding protein [Coriobacteriales bacterium]